MESTNFIAIIAFLLQSVCVQQLDLISVRPGTPQGYTAPQSQLLHTGTAVHSCKQCGKDLMGRQSGKAKFCDKKCHGNWLRVNSCGRDNPSWKGKTVTRTCVQCGYDFNAYSGRDKRFCSIKCFGENRRIICKNHPYRKGSILVCKTCGKEFYAERKQVTTGQKKYCSVKCNVGTIKKGQFAKEKHPMWRGEARTADVRARESEEYKQWRKAVMVRDGFTCQECGQKGGRLSAHHIKKFSKHSALRFFVPNGITLCWPCHTKINGHEVEHESRFYAKIEKLL